MPGLMDMHVHFGGEYQSKAERPVKVERETVAILAAKHAVITLDAGFTTVRQVGDSGLVAISLRDAINSNQVIGPRIFAAGKSIATTGGHEDPTNGMSVDNYDFPTPEEGVINGPYEAFTAVRQRYKDGADGIIVFWPIIQEMVKNTYTAKWNKIFMDEWKTMHKKSHLNGLPVNLD